MLWVVEAWRGIASALVLWSHWAEPLGLPVGLTAFAFTGVDLFFVLSGFVFAPVLLQRPVPSLRAYGLRRVLRIYPAYLVALALYVTLAWMAGRPLLYLPEHVLMGHLQSREMAFYYNPAFWSLPVEVGFYVLLPMLGVVLARGRAWKSRSDAWQRVGSAGHSDPYHDGGAPGRRFVAGRTLSVSHWMGWPQLLLLALAVRLVLAGMADGEAQNRAYVLLNHTPGLLIEFLLGVWVWQRGQRPLSPAMAWAYAMAGLGGWCALAALFVQTRTSAPGWLSGQLGFGAALCFSALLLASLQLTRPSIAALVLARWSGQLSYCMYLLHLAWLEPALAWSARWGTATGTSLALAGLLLSCLALHWCVEEPARRWGRHHAARWERGGTGASTE